ncbi:hypothetical protein [Pseudomonas oryzihabitans]|uniref:hypothetical protein n=1 Tax=Pseudomonas oryzihabitans TaxID=47885 RepID=UPI0028AF7E1B|nr:hypothetical protein [Pseudomonas oryzihabitans]
MDSLIDQQSPPSLESVRDKLILGSPRFGTVGVRDEHDRPTMENVAALLSEYEAQIAALAARLEGYQARAEFQSDRAHTQGMREQSDFRHEMELRDQSIHREIKSRERAFRRELAAHNKLLDYRLEKMEAATNQVVEATKASRYWIAGIGVAVILGIMGANATLIGSAASIFDGGKAALQRQQDLEKLARQAQEQSAQTQKILEAIQAQQNQPQTQQPKP